MPIYDRTLSSAKAFSEAEQLDLWIHQYLCTDGHNIPYSEGLHLAERYFIGPIKMPLSFFHRDCGPEPGMKYPVPQADFDRHVKKMEQAILTDPDMPPLMVNYYEHGFVLNDGSHRFQAYTNLGIDHVQVIVWITEPEEYQEFMEKYGSYVVNTTTIRRK